MNTIFRIQDKAGRGPWKPGFSIHWVESREDHKNLHPWIFEFGRVDKQVLFGEHCGSGCETIDQIKRWFTPREYKTLLSHGYRLVKMEVNRVIAKSDIQLFFGRAKPLNVDVEVIPLYETKL